MSTADELAKLNALRQQGVLSEAEFEAEKAKLLGPPPPMMAAPTTPVQSKQPKKKRKRGRLVFLLLVVVVIIIIIVAVSSSSSGPSAKITGKVASVIALDSNTVRVYITWTNTGKVAGSVACAMNTTVYNQFGDNVNIEVNSTNTNGNIRPGGTQSLYQDIGVNNGDAKFIKPSDVSFVGC